MMNRMMRWAFITLLSLFSLNVNNAYGQSPDGKLAELKTRYLWGSIYLTYGPVCDLYHILSKPDSLNKIIAGGDGAVALIVSNFLSQNKGTSMRDGIAFLQINLNTIEAGFMKTGDVNGVINKLNWSNAQVIQAANLFDKFLTGANQFAAIYGKILNNQSSIAEVWSMIQTAKESPFIPGEKIGLLNIGFRVLIENRTNDLNTLRTTRGDLYRDINAFKFTFDNKFMKFAAPTNGPQLINRGSWNGKKAAGGASRATTPAIAAATGGSTNEENQDEYLENLKRISTELQREFMSPDKDPYLDLRNMLITQQASP